jgi:protein O-GlcNAc transferase
VASFSADYGSYKLTPAIFDIWMRLLRQVDGSVLWIRNSYREASENLRREAEKRGVPADRLVFAKPAAIEAHLARHRLADLFLDT